MLLIGSRALMLRAPKALSRAPKDFDFICTREEYERWLDKNKARVEAKEVYPVGTTKMVVKGNAICEFEIIQPGSSAEMLHKIVETDPATMETSFGLIPNVDLLFTIKSSHKHLKNSPHFWKTLCDYHTLKRMGASSEKYKEFLKLREKETYTYAHPKLVGTNKKNFFADDQIKYIYDHDSLHEAVKHLDKPAYRFFCKDNEEVQSDKNKFMNADHEVKLYSVVEESAVLAIERSLVPHPGALTTEQAWRLAFSKVLTSITSGWWRTWAYDNAIDALKIYPKEYWDKFQVGLNNGIVKPFTGKTY